MHAMLCRLKHHNLFCIFFGVCVCALCRNGYVSSAKYHKSKNATLQLEASRGQETAIQVIHVCGSCLRMMDRDLWKLELWQLDPASLDDLQKRDWQNWVLDMIWKYLELELFRVYGRNVVVVSLKRIWFPSGLKEDSDF